MGKHGKDTDPQDIVVVTDLSEYDLREETKPRKTVAKPLVRMITINRAHARNALNTEIKARISSAIKDVDNSDTLRAVIITGAGDYFVAGADVKELKDRTAGDFLRDTSPFMYGVVDQCEIPVIAAVEGYAFGGGNELAMSCDIVVAAENATFGQPEIKVGLMPGAGGVSRLVHLAGRARASYALLTGEPFTAAQAQQMGIVSTLCPPGAAVDTALEIAAKISATPKYSVRGIRRIARMAENASLQLSIDAERQQFAQLFDTHDQLEGAHAFIEKRTPRYEGR